MTCTQEIALCEPKKLLDHKKNVTSSCASCGVEFSNFFLPQLSVGAGSDMGTLEVCHNLGGQEICHI